MSDVPGALNFRDVGGLPAGAARTRAGVLFRSGNLARLDDDGRAVLARLGIRRIVYASSETVQGLPFDVPPPYIPVDEEYPARPESVYSLVKHLEETMAIELVRWHPEVSITALRFSNVMVPEDYREFPGFDADARARKWNLWSYIDARDGAHNGWVTRHLLADAPTSLVTARMGAHTA